MIDNSAIDDGIVDAKLYASERGFHQLFEKIRKEDPVHWTQPHGFDPFWTISKHADVTAVERDPRFINGWRVLVQSQQVEQHMEKTFGQESKLRMILNMDDDEHRKYRGLTQIWFNPENLKKLDASLDALAREFIDRVLSFGGQCDFVNDIAVWYPLRVLMSIFGLPREDEELLLRLTQLTFGSEDEEVKRKWGKEKEDPAQVRAESRKAFHEYFTVLMNDRRRSPKDDLASVIANGVVDGKPITDLEVFSYYVLIATAGHDTTSSSISGGLLALLQNPNELAKLRSDRTLLGPAVEEMLRWVTPVKHFARTAIEDVTLRGKTIKAGERVMLCFASANRDEDVFPDSQSFRIDRKPNRQLAFGIGPHQCLGLHLGRMEINHFFRELLDRVDDIELAGEPSTSAGIFVNGLKHLPIRYKAKPKQKAA